MLGPDSFTFKANDGLWTSSGNRSTAKYYFVNEGPTISPLVPVVSTENTVSNVSFTIGEVSTIPDTMLTVSASSNNPDLISSSGLLLSGLRRQPHHCHNTDRRYHGHGDHYCECQRQWIDH